MSRASKGDDPVRQKEKTQKQEVFEGGYIKNKKSLKGVIFNLNMTT